MTVVLMCLIMLMSAFGALNVTSSKTDDGLDDGGGEYVPGELLIKFRDSASSESKEKVKDTLKAKELKAFKSCGAEHWKLGEDLDVEDALKKLEKHKEKDSIEYAEPNYYVYADTTPTASYRGSLWGMHNFGQTGGTSDADIDALELWGSYTDASSVVVGVIDTGIDYTHTDLKDNMWVNDNDPVNGVDDDANGYVDDHCGWDFVNKDNDPMDDNGHGTHTSGTIGAAGDNGFGVAGVCWDVQLMPLKFLNAGGSGSTDNAILAVDYAASFKDGNGDSIVRITSNSWGGGRKSKALENSIKNSGALFVASAGNRGSSSVQYPAGYNLDNIISVAATDHNDALASFSNYGSSWVDLGAPGVNVLSSLPSDSFGWGSGTSMSAPHVSGVAALLMGENPDWSLAAVKSQIMDTGDSLSSLDGKTVSGKRLNAASALGASSLTPDTVAPATVTDLAVSDPSFSELTLSWTAPGGDGTTGTAWLYDLRYSTSVIDGTTWDGAAQVALEPGPLVAGTTQSFTLTGLDDGTTFYIALKTYDEWGNLAGLSNVPSGATLDSPWDMYSVGNTGTAGRHNFAYDNDGAPTVVYKDTTTRDLNWAYMDRTLGTWTTMQVTTGVGGGGVDIAFDDSNYPGIVYYSDDEVWAAVWDGSSWDIDEVEPRKAYNDYCSIDFSGSYFGLTYFLGGRNGGLMYATYDGSSWTTEVVDSRAGARYSDLVYDSTGMAGIAYSDNNYGGDNLIDSMMFAKWDGTQWNIEEVEGGTMGYGVFCDLAYDSEDSPRLVHSNTASGVRYLEWDPDTEEWTLTIVGEADYAGYTGIVLTDSDVPYVCYYQNGDVLVGYLDGGDWTIEPVDLSITSGRGIFIDHYSGTGAEYVAMGYVDSQTSIVAEKAL